MQREILHIAGLEKTTPGFRRKLIEVADRRGLNPSYLAAVISYESGYNPQAVNPYSGATGLIQWLSSSAKDVGTTKAELMQMDAIQQLDYVERWYENRDPNKKIETPEDHYLAVFSPGYMFKAPGTPIFKRPDEGCTDPPKGAYCQNAPMDKSGDGVITNTEASAGVLSRIAAAQQQPPLVVEMNGGGGSLPVKPPSAEVLPASMGAAKIVPVVAGAVAGYWVVTALAGRVRRRA